MGLGGVAIAVLPSVVYPQTVVLGQAGGVNHSAKENIFGICPLTFKNAHPNLTSS